jgi:tetratricopeptide (TPR) repeat protein
MALLAAGGGGWWLGRATQESSPGDAARQALLQRQRQLELRYQLGDANEADKLRLLKLRLAVGDRSGAIELLEKMSDRLPQQWLLRLLLADLREQDRDRGGAEREIRQVLNMRPQQVEALEAITRLEVQRRRGEQSEARLSAAITASKGKPEALPLGLLMADLQQRMGKLPEAESTYRALIEANPEDPRPTLALALFKQEQGLSAEARQLLQQARQSAPALARPVLDQVATSWAVQELRNQPKPGSGANGYNLGGGT